MLVLRNSAGAIVGLGGGTVFLWNIISLERATDTHTIVIQMWVIGRFLIFSLIMEWGCHFKENK